MQIDIRFPTDDGHSLRGVLTLPEGAHHRERPGLVLVYEIFGLTDEMKRVARDLASAGYVVLIPDLFDRGPKPFCVARALASIQRGRGVEIDDLEAARRWLAERPDVDAGRLGVIGFCMGGGFALVLAMNGKYRVAAPFYGHVPADMPASCPVVGSFGARDRPFRGHKQRLEQHLTRLDVPHDVVEYEDAGHSFYTRAPSAFLDRIAPWTPMRAGYHEASARDAERRVLAFFDAHLRSDAEPRP